jgi:hypothetical protein
MLHATHLRANGLARSCTSTRRTNWFLLTRICSQASGSFRLRVLAFLIPSTSSPLSFHRRSFPAVSFAFCNILVPGTTHNDYYKFTMAPVIAWVEQYVGHRVTVTFSIDVRDVALAQRLQVCLVCSPHPPVSLASPPAAQPQRHRRRHHPRPPQALRAQVSSRNRECFCAVLPPTPSILILFRFSLQSRASPSPHFGKPTPATFLDRPRPPALSSAPIDLKVKISQFRAHFELTPCFF